MRDRDFFEYPLAGVHPHVYRAENTQYVLVRVASSQSTTAVQAGLTLTLDGDAMPLAERQPVPWTHDTVDLAFAVSKTETFDHGRLVFDQSTLTSLSEQTIRRLNTPPVFEVSNVSISPDKIQAGEQETATVHFRLRNVGDGCGTFGASLAGNFVSGSDTVTATLDGGARRDISVTTDIVGDADSATVRLDWGADDWSADIPVVASSTPT